MPPASTKQVSRRFSLDDFTVHEMMELSARLRTLTAESSNMEGASGRIVRYLYENLVSKESSKNACALVRFFQTRSYGSLNEELRQVARASLGGTETPEMKCLVLLATAGDRPEWNLPSQSTGHRAIPLPNENAIKKAPMIAQLLLQMGLSAHSLATADAPLMLDQEKANFKVFYVAEALGSPYVPAQDFVREAGIKSVVGFGGLLRSRDVFALVLFSNVAISRPTAELFSSLGLMVKLGVARFDQDPVPVAMNTRAAAK
ncbi:MAG: hypothetical protein ABSG72_03210 [Candidatus Sulfotelmatobacter sp.]|jgi:hypothetical protein